MDRKKTTSILARLFAGAAVSIALSSCSKQAGTGHAGHDHADHEGHDHADHEGHDHAAHAEEEAVTWDALEHIDIILHDGLKALKNDDIAKAASCLSEIGEHTEDLASTLPQGVHNPLAAKEAVDRFVALVKKLPAAASADGATLAQAFADLDAIVEEVSTHSGMAHQH